MEETHLEKICEICGAVGFVQLLATCSKCRVTQEHLYCMRVLFRDGIENWVCEACISCEDIASPVSPGCGWKEDLENYFDRSHSDALIDDGYPKDIASSVSPGRVWKEESQSCSDRGHHDALTLGGSNKAIASPVSIGCGRKEDLQNCSDTIQRDAVTQGGFPKTCDVIGIHHHSKRQKVVNTGKVKFLTAEEVIKLSSEATKMESPSKRNCRYGLSFSAITPKFSPSRLKANPRILSSCLITSSRHGTTPTSSTSNQQSLMTSKGQKPSVGPAKEHNCKEQVLACHQAAKEVSTCNASGPAQEMQTFNANGEQAADKSSCSFSPLIPCNGQKPSASPAKEHNCNEQTIACRRPAKEVSTCNASMPAQETQTCNVNGEQAVDKSSFSSSPLIPDNEQKTSASPPKECNGNQEKIAGQQAANEIRNCNASMPAKETKTCNANLEQFMDISSFSSSPPVAGIGKSSYCVANPISSNVEKRDLPNILSKLRLYRPHFPAKHAIWKGGFKIDAATRGLFFGGFQAQPPSTVHRKAYEASQTIPKILQLKVLPQHDILADLFQDGFPDFRDIALYFFPFADIERSQESYASLVQRLETKNEVMRSYFDGTELLIFTSKHLNMDSQDFIASSGMECFLWGIFRHAKQDALQKHFGVVFGKFYVKPKMSLPLLFIA